MNRIKELVYNTETGQPKARIELFKENNDSFFVRLSLRCTQMDELVTSEFLKGTKKTIQAAYCEYQGKAYTHTEVFGHPTITVTKGI